MDESYLVMSYVHCKYTGGNILPLLAGGLDELDLSPYYTQEYLW